MGTEKIVVDGYRCLRCGHTWVPRDKTKEPKVCPKCKNPYWNVPRRNADAEAEAETETAARKRRRKADGSSDAAKD